MRGASPLWAFLPPLLVGMAAGTAAELAAGLLLFSEEGFLPALTLILTVEVAALGIGLWTRPLPIPGGEVEELRRGWLFALVAYALAAAFAAALLLFDEGSRTGAGQGIGLAIMGSLPLFAVGSLLGSMARVEGGRKPVSGVGAPSVVGAALGFLLTGTLILPHVAAHTAFLLCMVALSGGALVHGVVLDARPSAEIRESLESPLGRVRVEDRIVGRPPRRIRVLTEGGRLRGAEDESGAPARPWEAAVLAGVLGEAAAPSGVLIVGGGAGTLSRQLRSAHPELPLRVMERTPELVEVARRSFHPWIGWEGVGVEVGDPLDLLRRPSTPVPLVVVDVGVLPSLGPLPFLRDQDWEAVRRVCSAGGVVVLGGMPTEDGEEGDPGAILRQELLRWFQWADLYRGEAMAGPPWTDRDPARGAEALLVAGREGSRRWSPALPGFRLLPRDEG